MKLAYIFSGQGTQCTGMGEEFYENYAEFREVYENTNVGFDIKEICFLKENEAKLNRTQYTQPCLVAYQIGVTKILENKGIEPQYAAGVSLGEYSALYTAGIWSEQETLEIVKYRGLLMEESVKNIKCKTASIIGLSNAQVENLCIKGRKYGIVDITNYCCEGNITIGGEAISVDYVIEQAKLIGAKKCIMLKSEYPFHTELLSKAGDKLEDELKKKKLGKMKIPVIFNYTGNTQRSYESIPYLLKMQIQKSIFLEKTIKFLESEGVDTIFEISPFNVNSKIINRISDKIRTLTISSQKDIEEAQRILNLNF